MGLGHKFTDGLQHETADLHRGTGDGWNESAVEHRCCCVLRRQVLGKLDRDMAQRLNA